MSAYDQSNNMGSFRGAAFLVTTDDLVFGRRVKVHEYPLRDKPYVEDMGPVPDQFTISVTVIGPTYEADRDALIKALNKPGPGELIHPKYGTFFVSIIKPRKREIYTEEGKATFSLPCVVGDGLPEPVKKKETPPPVEDAADKTIVELINEFAEIFDVIGQAADFVQDVQDEIDSVLAAVEDAVSGVIDPLASLIRSPYNLAASITGSINRVSSTLNDPLQALSLYEGLFNAGSNTTSVSVTTANRQQQVDNIAALHTLIRGTAVAEAARVSLKIDFVSSNDALSVRDRILAALDEQIDSAPDVIYQTMVDLRVAIANDLLIRGARLPEITHYTPRAVLPALVLAYQVLGDASRDSEIISRNNISHPGFVSGGEALEVLSV